MRYRVLPYRQGSKGAKALATALGGKVLKLVGSGFIPKPNDVIVNWGNVGNITGPLLNSLDQLVNDPCVIRRASNKLNFFRLMRDRDLSELIPPFWENAGDIPPDAFPIVCRTVLAGHSGDGIVIANSSDDLVPAPLYVKYIKKQEEYRIHVGLNNAAGEGETTIIAIQRKARNLSVPNPNWQVRNHSNGFIYVRGGVNPPESVVDAARRALIASGLDFGAVDVIWNAEKEKAYVLEINTAPGLEGQTIDDYANYFKG